MPRIKRRAHRRKLVWGRGHTVQLQTGHSYFHDESFGREDRGTLDIYLVRSVWVDLGPELLAQWIAEHPRTRPWAWWKLAASERRMRIGSCVLKPGRKRGGDDDDYRFVDDGKPHPFDNPEREERVVTWRQDYPAIADRDAYRLSFGTPNCLMVFDDFDAVYESEHAYLERLGLLTAGERKGA